MSLLRNQEPSLITRLVEKILSKLTFTTNGLRTETVIASGAVSAVNAASNVALGRVTADGMGIQMSYLNYQQGYRRNLIIT